MLFCLLYRCEIESTSFRAASEAVCSPMPLTGIRKLGEPGVQQSVVFTVGVNSQSSVQRRHQTPVGIGPQFPDWNFSSRCDSAAHSGCHLAKISTKKLVWDGATLPFYSSGP